MVDHLDDFGHVLYGFWFTEKNQWEDGNHPLIRRGVGNLK